MDRHIISTGMVKTDDVKHVSSLFNVHKKQPTNPMMSDQLVGQIYVYLTTRDDEEYSVIRKTGTQAEFKVLELRVRARVIAGPFIDWADFSDGTTDLF